MQLHRAIDPNRVPFVSRLRVVATCLLLVAPGVLAVDISAAEVPDDQTVRMARRQDRVESEERPGRVDARLATNVQLVAPKWLVVEATNIKSEGGATLTLQDDGSYLAAGTNASHDVYTFTVTTARQGITAVRIEALADASLPNGGPGRAANGNFALSDFQLWAAPTGAAGPGSPVKLVTPKATFEQKGLPAASAIDDNKKSAWAVDPEVGRDHSAAFDLETPLANRQGATLTFILRFENNTGYNLGRVRLSLSTAAKPVALDGEQVAVK